ncbi:MAG: tripartite tricarboxylate transporter substrate binding protein [Betaproteobacteria bacterium]|jgi:tripartite-type tricarboxylate transporter receptor subunit TctC|nr:tripartite tricarboxylate transporter substrate binding protein [Betaproteobacteria bacterium]NBT68503.1 tripartite tricarboxylate transporter substrate binding protein [Betaproteobacteria bacterium]NBY08354.1 tripartite tricarboxylate transporter substrate binding protein [Betaproteobacteria bacterium]
MNRYFLKKMTWVGLFAISSIIHAQGFPERNLTGVVPFPPGGGTDIFGRLVADQLGKQLSQTIVVENRPGADGNIGMEYVSKSNPNGYTLLFNSSAATVNPVLYSKLRFDPLKDLTPIGIACEYYNVIVINPEKTQAKTLAEFLDLIKKNPGKINAGAGGTRLVIDMFTSAGKLDVAVIPYKGGGDAITAVLKGEVDFIIINTPGIIQFLNQGKLKALAVTGPKRQFDIPDVPTTKEAGMPDYVYSSFFGVYVQGNTPDPIKRKLNSALNEITQKPEVIAAFRRGGAEPVQKSVEDASQRYLEEIKRLKDLAVKVGIPTLD